MKANMLEQEIQSLKELINERFDRNECDHQRIIEQTTKTNGRVSALETLKNKVVGAITITNVMVVPIIVYFLIKFLDK